MKQVRPAKYIIIALGIIGFFSYLAFSSSRKLDTCDLVVLIGESILTTFCTFMQFRKDKKNFTDGKIVVDDEPSGQTKLSRFLSFFLLVVCGHIIHNANDFAAVINHRLSQVTFLFVELTTSDFRICYVAEIIFLFLLLAIIVKIEKKPA